MRREWTALVRERNWDALERLAKTEPSQQLTDTVAELMLGMDEKADRRALKKVLWLLSQAGFEPTEIEDAAPPLSAERGPYAQGLLVSADGEGKSVVCVGIEERGKVRWLHATVGLTGIAHAFEDESTLDGADAHLQSLAEKYRVGYEVAKVSAEYALGRLAAALRAHPDRVPTRIAYWRARLEAAPEIPHPAQGIPPAETTTEDRRTVSLVVKGAAPWRVEMGLLARVLAELGQEQAREEGQPGEDHARTEARLDEARRQIFTPERVSHHVTMLHDLALGLHQRGDDTAKVVMSAAQELAERGAESDYARGITAKSIILLAERWKREVAAE